MYNIIGESEYGSEILDTAKKYLVNPLLSISGKKSYCNQIKKIWQDRF